MGQGILGTDVKAADKQASLDGARVLSAYILPVTGTRIWITIEADRSYGAAYTDSCSLCFDPILVRELNTLNGIGLKI